ncbi:MAG: flagellar export protein FliJ [Magnetococcus sp. DMHC-6]
MNRFSRLVELRRLKEEIKGSYFALALGKVQKLEQEKIRLENDMEQVRQTELQESLQPENRLPPKLLEDYFKGQKWRLRRLQQVRHQANLEMERTRQIWNQARVELKQSEKLAERADEEYKSEQHKREIKEMDIVGIMASMRR